MFLRSSTGGVWDSNGVANNKYYHFVLYCFCTYIHQINSERIISLQIVHNLDGNKQAYGQDHGGGGVATPKEDLFAESHFPCYRPGNRTTSGQTLKYISIAE